MSWRGSPAIPHMLLRPAILASAALALLLLARHTELVQGQAADVPTSILVVVALLVGTVLHDKAWCRRLLDVVVRPWSPALIALVAFVVLAVGSYLVFGARPASPDEQIQLFQARLFAQFKVAASYPPGLFDRIIPLAYQNTGILVSPDGRAMSVYWPGWALLMTPFVWLGAPSLLGPAMASLGLYVVGRLTSLLAGAQAAAIAILLTVTSGAFIVTGMSLYPSGGYLTLNLLYAWLLLRGGRRSAVLAGLVGGLALNLNNPVPHTLFALPWLVWLAADSTRRRQLIWLAIGYAPWVAVSCAWLLATLSLNASTPGGTGNFWQGRLPLLVNLPTLQIASFRFWELIRLWIWSAPGLLVLALLAWRLQTRWSGAWVLGGAFGLTVVLYVFFPAGQGLGWGARYYQSSWGALPILAAILLIRPDAEVLRRIVLTAALAGLILVVPLQLVYARDTAQGFYGGPTSVDGGSASIHALASPGVDLYFIDFNGSEDSSITFATDASLTDTLVLVSYGPIADQEIVDRYFPGARLVIRNSFGSGYARP